LQGAEGELNLPEASRSCAEDRRSSEHGDLSGRCSGLPSEADDNKSRMTDNVPKIMGVDKYVGQQMKTSMGNMKSPVELLETSLNLPHWRVLQRGLRSQQRLTGLRKWEWESL
jgi:hypothetical protein